MVRMASRGDTPHGGSYVCVCHQDDAQRARPPRTKDRRARAKRGSKGRQAAPDRVNSVGAEWVRLVYTRLIRPQPKDPRTGKVLGRLPFDDGSMAGGSMPTVIDHA